MDFSQWCAVETVNLNCTFYTVSIRETQFESLRDIYWVDLNSFF